MWIRGIAGAKSAAWLGVVLLGLLPCLGQSTIGPGGKVAYLADGLPLLGTPGSNGQTIGPTGVTLWYLGTDGKYYACTLSSCFGGGSMFRALNTALASATVNPTNQPPLIAPPAWATSTNYSPGNVATNGGNLYLNMAGNGGSGGGSPCTSASTGSGPSGTGAASITDGTCDWYYYGVATTTTSSVLAPVITSSGSTPSGLTLAYNVFTNSSDFGIRGGWPVAYNTNWAQVAAYTVPNGSGNLTGGTLSGTYPYVTFYTDAPKFSLNYGSLYSFQVIVDGQYVFQGSTALGYVTSGCCNYMTLDFTNSGGRRTRKVTMTAIEGAYFANVNVDPNSKVWAPAEPAITAYVFGDSTCVGSSAGPIDTGDSWPVAMGFKLGWPNVVNGCEGGTGYLASVAGTYPFSGHLTDAVTAGANVVLFWGGANDVGTYTPAQIQAAALADFQNVRAELPGALIFVFGIYPGATGPSATVTAGEAAIQAAAEAMPDYGSGTFFIPVATDPTGAWLSGTGTTTAPTTSGNSSVCVSGNLGGGVHPTDPCIVNYIAPRVATALANIIRSQH